MKLNLGNGDVLPIGVDIGTSAVKMAQLRFVDGTYELIAAGSAEIPDSSRKDGNTCHKYLTEKIRQVYRSGGFKGRECVMSIPAKDTFVRHLKLPNTPDGDMASTLEAEFGGKLPYPLADAIIRHMVAGEIYDDDEAKQEVIVVAANRRTVESYLNMVNRAGLEIIGVNIEACAIVECFSRLFQRTSDASRTTLFIDIGAASTQVVLSHGTHIVFAHNLKRGADQLDQALVKTLQLPPDRVRQLRLDMIKETQVIPEVSPEQLYRLLDEPLALLTEELTQCLRYYESAFPNRSIERAIFVGGQACDTRLCQVIAQRLNLPAQIGDPLLRFRCAEGAGASMGLNCEKPFPALAVAVGLSLGARSAA